MRLDFPKHNRFWVLGLTFLQNYYAVFDVENKRVGLAQSKLGRPS